MKILQVLKEKRSAVIYGVIFLLLLAPIILISKWSRPCVDDFAYSWRAYREVQSGSWNIFSLLQIAVSEDIGFYKTWQGLYSSAFLLALQPGIFGEKVYFIGSIALIAVTYFCVTSFLFSLKKVFLPAMHDVWVIAGGITAIIFSTMPSLVQGLFWFNGAWNYMFFWDLVLWNLSLVIRYEYGTENKTRWIIGASILSFIISGGNHVTSFLNIMILFLLFLRSLYLLKTKTVMPLLTSLIGFAVMYFAPGTKVRQDMFHKPGVINTIFASIKELGRMSVEWTHWWFVILVILLALYVSKQHQFQKKIHPFLVLFLSWGMMVGLFCVPYYAMGHFGVGRVYNMFYLTYLSFFALNMIYFVSYYQVEINVRSLLQIPVRLDWKAMCCVVCVCAICLSGQSNSVRAMRELRDGTAREYVSTFDRRLKIQAESQDEIVVVDRLPGDSILYFDDISDNVEDWRNQSWSSYYQKKVIAQYR